MRHVAANALTLLIVVLVVALRRRHLGAVGSIARRGR